MRVGHLWRPIVAALLVLALAGAFTWLAFAHARRAELEAAHGAFREEAAERTGLLQLELTRRVESLETLGELLQVRPERAADEVASLGGRILERFPGLYSIAWSDWVPHAQRDEIVDAIRSDGYAIADVYARDDAGRLVRAPERDHSLVVRQMVPEALAPLAVGFDVMSRSDRRDAVSRAIDSGGAAATEPVELGADPSDISGVIIFMPIFDTPDMPDDRGARRTAFLGTVSIGFRIAPALGDWLEGHRSPLVQTVIYDLDDAGYPHTLLEYGLDPARPGTDVSTLAAHPMAEADTVEFAGRTWSILHVPAPHLDTVWREATEPKLVLGFGLALSMLLAGAVGLYVRAHDLARQVADERAAAAEEVSRANDHLRAVNEDMEHFTSAVAHDLRSPLMAIRGVAHVVRRQLDNQGGGATARSLDVMERSAQAMEGIIDSLVDHAHAGYAPIRGEDIDLDALVRKVIEEHASDAERVGAVVDVVGPLPVAFGDRGRLAAAFGNLLGNALKYGQPTPHGGPLHIVIGAATEADRPSEDVDAATHWAFYVRDDGPGVPPEQRAEIFEAFRRRSDRSRGGLGIGLATVARTARVHGGKAWVEDSPGEHGATFWLTIARAKSEGDGAA